MAIKKRFGYSIKGERFKLLREERDYELDKNKKCTQGMLAKELGISTAQISDLERGIRTPSFNELVRYCDYFDVPMEYLLGKIDNRYYKNVSIGRRLGLSDDVINALEKYSGTGASFVNTLNEIYRIGYGWKFLSTLHDYFVGDYSDGGDENDTLIVGDFNEDGTGGGTREPIGKLNRLYQLELYDLLQEMREVFKKKGFNDKDLLEDETAYNPYKLYKSVNSEF